MEFTGVHLASRTGNLAQLKEILLRDSSQAGLLHEESGLYPMHLAIKGGHVECVDVLLEHGSARLINMAVQELIGGELQENYALHMAVVLESNAFEMVVCLLHYKHGTKVNIQTPPNGETVLHLACMNGSKKLIDLLLKKRAPIMARDVMRELPHHYAARSANVDALKAIWNFDHKMRNGLNSVDARKVVGICAETSREKKDLELLKVAFSEYGWKIREYDMGDELLTSRVEKNDLNGFTYLLDDARCCPLKLYSNRKLGLKMLQTAIGSPFFATYLPLLKPYLTVDVLSKINNNDQLAWTPVQTAISGYGVPRLDLVLNLGFVAKISKNEMQHYGVFKFVEKWLCNMYSYQSTVSLCLHHSQSVNKIELLLQHGTSVNVRDDLMVPLVAALCRERSPIMPDSPGDQVVKLLIESGVDWNHRSSRSQFKGSDLAICSSLTGNVSILRRALKATAVSPVYLLQDLNKACSNFRSSYSADLCEKFGRHLGVAVVCILKEKKNIVGSQMVADQVKMLERAFWNKESNGVNVVIEKDDCNQKIWRLVHALLFVGGNLQQRCRSDILMALLDCQDIEKFLITAAATGDYGDHLSNLIDVLSLSEVLKSFLKCD